MVSGRGPADFTKEEEALLKQLAGIASLALQHLDAKSHAEQRAAEAEEGKEILEALMEYVPTGITIADASTARMRMMSQHGRQMFGLLQDNITGISLHEPMGKWDVFRKDGITRPSGEELPLSRATLHGEEVRDEEWVLRRHNREPITLFCSAGPILDKSGRITGGIMAWRDISALKAAQESLRQARDELELRVQERTAELAAANHALVAEIAERNRAEEALRRSEEQLRHSNAMLQKFFDGISEPLIMLDRELLVKMLNRAAQEYYGLADDDDVLGRPCFEALQGEPGLCPECKYPSTVGEWQAQTIERRGVMDANRFEQVVVYPVMNEKGERDAAIIRISDITQAKFLERQLVQSEKLASLGLLVSGIAHEINNPNTFISFNIPILRDYLQELMPIIDGFAEDHPNLELFSMKYQEFREDLFKLVGNMEHGSSRINRIVSDLKRFVKKRDRIEPRCIDLRVVIEKAVNICHAEIRKKVKSFDVLIPEEMPLILTDPEVIEQVLVNLLINAVQAADKDDSWVKLRGKWGRSRERYCVLEVIDNGSGMEEAVKDKIFDPFFTTKASSSGTGLGLYVCYTLVDSLGGKIEVESQLGQGSTFRIVLPEMRQPEEEREGLVQ